MQKVFLSLLLLAWFTVDSKTNPRVIVLTDGETDDRCSMVHFLLHSNDMQVDAIIQTNSCFQKNGWSHSPWLNEMLDAYAEVYDNLKVHDDAYPTPQYLRDRVYVGDENPQHIKIEWRKARFQLPGLQPQVDPTEWADTPGSDRIVEILLEDDARPVFIQCWGGANTAARAFHKLKTEYPDEYDRAVSKAVLYCIWYQDDAGPYIELYHPKATILLNHHFSGSWDYGTMTNTTDFVDKYMHRANNPLGMLYTQSYVSEGDTPAFLYTVNNGLRSYENPTFGGWGGRFYKIEGHDNVYRDTGPGNLREWIEAAMHDYQTRLKWCVSPRYEDANHHPVIKVGGGFNLNVHSGDTVVLKANIYDPDPMDGEAIWESKGELLTQAGITKEMVVANPQDYHETWGCGWSQYPGGTYQENVDLFFDPEDPATVKFIAPEVSQSQTIHIILEAYDMNTPRLTSYARYIVTVLPL